ncbi:hypothetical protein DM860_013758 [Cuscuta australis]|uniref:O-methyltransferase dimerisation domain-containing protein n=1 Tax=Cuscuta australis TaxID=267555 RepID=A0A328DHU7_9ASTE|nr:hypothetical protein DM860_013758 [Cuscuta australis]
MYGSALLFFSIFDLFLIILYFRFDGGDVEDMVKGLSEKRAVMGLGTMVGLAARRGYCGSWSCVMAGLIGEHEESSRLEIMELDNMISVSMSLNAVVRLNVTDSIWQGGSNSPISAADMLFVVLPSGGGDAEYLQRILCMLTSYGVFHGHFDPDNDTSS